MGIEVKGDELKLYIRLPVKIIDEVQIRDLHPSIGKIWLPRQKSRRWCIVDFPDVDTREKAREELKKKKINGRKIFIGDFKRPDKTSKISLNNCIFVEPFSDSLPKNQ